MWVFNRVESKTWLLRALLLGEILDVYDREGLAQDGNLSFLGNHPELFTGGKMAVIQLKMNRD